MNVTPVMRGLNQDYVRKFPISTINLDNLSKKIRVHNVRHMEYTSNHKGIERYLEIDAMVD